MRVQKSFGLEREDGEIISGVDTEQLLSAKLEYLHRSLGRQWEDNLDALLSKNVYLTVAEVACRGTNGDEGLDRVVGNLGYSRIYAEL